MPGDCTRETEAVEKPVESVENFAVWADILLLPVAVFWRLFMHKPVHKQRLWGGCCRVMFPAHPKVFL